MIIVKDASMVDVWGVPAEFQEFFFVSASQLGFEFVGGVKVILNGAFALARDKDHVSYTCRVSFF